MRSRNREKDEIPSWYIGNRNVLTSFFARSILGHDRRASECRATNSAKIQRHHQVICDAQGGCDLPSPLYLHGMALPIGNREEEELVSLPLGQRRRDGRIQASARQNDRSRTRWFHHLRSNYDLVSDAQREELIQ